jgi:type I restriction enzyme R subunit
MLGRATRLCDEIGKEAFRVFDAVNLYSTISKVSEMKPVVNKPNFSFSQLVDELGTVQDSAAIESIIDELLAKLQRKKRSLNCYLKKNVESTNSKTLLNLSAIANGVSTHKTSFLKPQSVLGWNRG